MKWLVEGVEYELKRCYYTKYSKEKHSVQGRAHFLRIGLLRGLVGHEIRRSCSCFSHFFLSRQYYFIWVCSGLSILQYNRWLAIRMVKKYGGFFLLPLDVAVGQLFDFGRESGERIVSQVKQF